MRSERLTIRTRPGLAALGSLLFAAQAAAGPLHQFSQDDIDGNPAAGELLSLTTTYDAGSAQLTWSPVFDDTPTGFWLVVSPGPNPKGEADELAILYGDSYTGNLTAYVYNGENNDSSWLDQPFIGSYAGVLDAALGFSVNVAAINSFMADPTWTGAAYGEQIGIWYHPFLHAEDHISYAEDGSFESYYHGVQGWYDLAWGDTMTVAEPRSGWLVATGLLLLAFFSRRRRRSIPALASFRRD